MRSSGFIELGVLALVVLTCGLALFAAFLVWRRGYVRGWLAARANPPTCPKCGYNLSGQLQCRCPECGFECRLDELWRSSVISKPSKVDAAKPGEMQV